MATLPRRNSSSASPPRSATFCDSPSASTELSPENVQCQNGPNGTTRATASDRHRRPGEHEQRPLEPASAPPPRRVARRDHADHPGLAGERRKSDEHARQGPRSAVIRRARRRSRAQPGSSARCAKFAACASVGWSAVAPAMSSPAAHHPARGPATLRAAYASRTRGAGQTQRGDDVQRAEVTGAGGEERAGVDERRESVAFGR